MIPTIATVTILLSAAVNLCVFIAATICIDGPRERTWTARRIPATHIRAYDGPPADVQIGRPPVELLERVLAGLTAKGIEGVVIGEPIASRNHAPSALEGWAA